ncbi:MAG: cyclophilin-like fold protein [Candidatus Odinarchaeia archaeon]
MGNELGRYHVIFKIPGIGEAEGELLRFKTPRTVEALMRKLPIKSETSVWKEEVYFTVGIKVGREKPSKTVETGDIAYWPMGDALCVFYGKTQPYSEVNVCGRILNNLEIFKKVKIGHPIILEKAAEETS